MSPVLLDTNVLSYIMRGHPLGVAYSGFLTDRLACISFMTVAELYEGAFRADWGTPRLGRLNEGLKGYTVIPFSAGLCQTWARIRAGRRRQPIAVDDAWIAASALAIAAPLLTHHP